MRDAWTRLVGALSDPLAASSWVAGAMVAAAFIAFHLAWRGAAATLAVPVQVPYLVSGGVGGLCLLIAGLTLLHTQTRRRRTARTHRQLGELVAEAEALLEAVRTRHDEPA